MKWVETTNIGDGTNVTIYDGTHWGGYVTCRMKLFFQRVFILITILLMWSAFSAYGVDATENSQVIFESGLAIALQMDSRQKGVVIFEVANRSRSRIEVVCNIPSLHEHLFVDFPRSAAIQLRSISGKTIEPKQPFRKNWWKPSASSAFMPVDWKYFRNLVLEPNEVKKVFINTRKAMEFAKTTDVFGKTSEDWSELKVRIEIVIREGEEQQSTTLTSAWLKYHNK